MRPWTAEYSPNEKDHMVIVKTEFTARDGTIYYGYSSPHPTSDLGYIQPTIVTDRGQVNFWRGMYEPEEEQLREAYDILGKTASQLFPISFVSMADGFNIRGQLGGFVHSPNPDDNETKTVQ